MGLFKIREFIANRQGFDSHASEMMALNQAKHQARTKARAIKRERTIQKTRVKESQKILGKKRTMAKKQGSSNLRKAMSIAQEVFEPPKKTDKRFSKKKFDIMDF